MNRVSRYCPQIEQESPSECLADTHPTYFCPLIIIFMLIFMLKGTLDSIVNDLKYTISLNR